MPHAGDSPGEPIDEDPMLVTAPESPMLVTAPESPMLVTAPESPMLETAPENPMLVTAPESPMLVTAPEIKLMVTAPKSPYMETAPVSAREPHDGDGPREPRDGDIPREPRDGDIAREPRDGDSPREPKDVENTKDPNAFLINHTDFTDLCSLLGKYVVVLYNGKPYPTGLVVNIRDKAVEVNCMQRIGKQFAWPKYIKDINWYLFEDIVAVIPEPLHGQGRYYKVEEGIWNIICSKYN